MVVEISPSALFLRNRTIKHLTNSYFLKPKSRNGIRSMMNMIFDNCDWNYPTCGGYRVYEGRTYWHIDSLSNYQGTREFRYSLTKSEYTKDQVTDTEWIKRNEEYFVDCYDNRRIPEGIKIKYLGKVY